MSTMLLEVVTPERKVYSKEVRMAVVKAVDGELGILPRHIPLVTPLKIGPLRAIVDGGEDVIAVNGGFMEVHDNHVIILAESAELPDEIDVDRAEAAKRRAEERLRKAKQEEIDFRRAELALQRAINRLGVASRRR